jgi:hypothetical protein
MSMSECLQESKVYYQPIEAAIRWAGLLKYEREILLLIPAPKNQLPQIDCPRWSELRLCIERIYDAIFNQDLPYGRNGITQHDETLWQSPELTVRHVDLKKWMRDHYPEYRPEFLFGDDECIPHPAITLETGQALLIEREALKTELAHWKRQFQEMQQQYQALLKQYEKTPACDGCTTSNRAEITYQNIIGAMLSLMLGHSPAGQPYSSFRTQDAITSALIAHYGGAMGISERTLQRKFAQAQRRMVETSTTQSDLPYFTSA